MIRPPPISTLFPYTTLFRSHLRWELFSPAMEAAEMVRVEVAVPEPGVMAAGENAHPMPTGRPLQESATADRKNKRLNSSQSQISYAVFSFKKKTHDIELYSL